jgi:hypothetical protein
VTYVTGRRDLRAAGGAHRCDADDLRPSTALVDWGAVRLRRRSARRRASALKGRAKWMEKFGKGEVVPSAKFLGWIA